MNAQKTQSQGAQPRGRTEDPQIATCFPGHQSPSKMLKDWWGGVGMTTTMVIQESRKGKAEYLLAGFTPPPLQLPDQILLTIPPQTLSTISTVHSWIQLQETL